MQAKNNYDPETDGRIYRLCIDKSVNKHFINFEEREIVEMAEILMLRRKKLALKMVALVEEVGADNPNILLQEIKAKWLGR